MSAPYALKTGVFDGSEAGEKGVQEGAKLVFTGIIQADDTPWMRVHFGEYNLGSKSYIILTSLKNGDSQRLDSTYMPIYSNISAVFRGNRVELKFYVATGDTGVFVTVDGLRVANPASFGDGKKREGKSICGSSDDRWRSNDPRVGRLGGGTAWLVHNGAALTAGHVGEDDGNIVGEIVEFNVPTSQSNGVSVWADIEDQYPVTSVVSFESHGEGEDYNVFTIGRNSETGERAHIAQGFFHMTGVVPSEGATVRVTGYGLDPFPSGTGGAGAACCDWDSDENCNNDCNFDSKTQQSHTGPCDDCLEGTAVEHMVDTLPGDSGAPVIWESTGKAIAIHAQGGCDSLWSDYDNAGTWLGYGPLANALHFFLGSKVVYVDAAASDLPFNAKLGLAIYPFDNVADGVQYVQDGGVVAIVAGSYPASAGNTFVAGAGGKRMTLTAPVGPVAIGN